MRDLYAEIGRPGAAKFHREARARGYNINRETAKSFVQGRPSNQLLAPRPKYEGKSVATERNAVWQADLIDRANQSGQHKYALVVSDVHTREVHAEPLKNKTPAETAKAFKEIINEEGDAPKQLTTDQGGEFRGAFAKEAKEHAIVHIMRDRRALNDLAVVDSTIGSMRRSMGAGSIATRQNWSKHLASSVHAFNDTGKKSLYGSSPNEAVQNDQLGFLLQSKAGYDIQHNEYVGQARANKLETMGAFRDLLPPGRDRQDKPRYSDRAHEVAHVTGTTVTDTEGNKFQTKLVRAVPLGSADVDTSYMKATREKLKRVLRPFGDTLEHTIHTGLVGLKDLQTVMHRQPGFTQALKQNKTSFHKFVELFADVKDGTASRRQWRMPPEPDETQRARFAARNNPDFMRPHSINLKRGMTLAAARSQLDRNPNFREDLGMTGQTFKEFLQKSGFKVNGNMIF